MEDERNEKGGRRCRWLSCGSAISETITILVPVGGGRGFRSRAMTAPRDTSSLSLSLSLFLPLFLSLSLILSVEKRAEETFREGGRRRMKTAPGSSGPGTPPSNIKCRINAGHDRLLPRLCNGVRVHEPAFPLSASRPSASTTLRLHASLLFAPSLPLSLLCPHDPMHQTGQLSSFIVEGFISLSTIAVGRSYRVVSAWIRLVLSVLLVFTKWNSSFFLFLPFSLLSLFLFFGGSRALRTLQRSLSSSRERPSSGWPLFPFRLFAFASRMLPLAEYLVRSQISMEFRSEELRSGRLFGCRYIREMRELQAIRLMIGFLKNKILRTEV